jgi:histidinol phosphatase-like enzyme (inositol monophosphatase family)
MTNGNPEIRRRLDLALSAARVAGRRTLDFFQQEGLRVDRKPDRSPVTAADRDAEQILRRIIREAFPGDAILGEEYGREDGTSGFCWILDPIDGTKSFICGVPLYGTLIGVEHEQHSIVGVICLPALDECVFAGAGEGAWYVKGGSTPRPAKVSACQDLSDGVFLTSQVDSFATRNALGAYLELEKRASITRTWGDCFGYLLVATGRADVMVDPIMNLWDAAALQPILEEAGGVFTDWRGQRTIHSGEGIGCNQLLLEQVLSITRPHARR